MKRICALFTALLLLCGCRITALPAPTAPSQAASPSPEEATETAAPSPMVSSAPTAAPSLLPSATAAPSLLPSPTEPATPPTAQPLSGRLVCIDPGHCISPLAGKGYTEPVSPLSDAQKTVYGRGTAGANLSEVALNLILGLKLRDSLQALGAEVILTREVSELTIGGVERCDIPNHAGADVCVRIHADGSTNKALHGVSVLIPTGELLGTPAIEPESARLGQLMVDAVAAETGAQNRGTKGRSDLTGFNFSQVPTVLIEVGFMTNPEEDAKLETERYQDQIVAGMTQALLDWYASMKN